MGFKIRFDDAGTLPKPGHTVRRFDLQPLRKPEKTADGFMKAQGFLTRVGVFDYVVQDENGQPKTIRELRPPEEVFNAESLESFALLPLTLDHPQDNLTPKTVRQYQRGTVGRPVVVEDHVRADILITDQEAIDAVEGGKNQLSCGYGCDPVVRSGVFTDGSGREWPFDVVQTKIRGNHVSIVDQARAGPTAAIRLDSGDGVMAASSQETKGDTMKLKLNDEEFEVPEAVGKAFADLQDKLKAATANDEDPPTDPKDQDPPKEEEKTMSDEAKKLADAEAKLAATEGRLAAVEAALNDRAKQDAAQELAILRHDATALLGAEAAKAAKIEELDAIGVRKAVIAKLNPSARLDGKDAAYVLGVYEASVELAASKVQGGVPATGHRVDTSSRIAAIVGEAKDQSAWRNDKAEDAYDRSVKAMTEAWKPKALRDAEAARNAG